MGRYLVTGGAGYIGSHAVKALLEKGWEPVVVDNLDTGHREAVPAAVPFYLGDVRDSSFLQSVFGKENIVAVMHFAARSLVGESMADPLAYFHNNTYGMMVLLDAMKRKNIDKIIFLAYFGICHLAILTSQVAYRVIDFLLIHFKDIARRLNGIIYFDLKIFQEADFIFKLELLLFFPIDPVS